MLEQAIRLLQLAPGVDEEYVGRRIATETADAYDLRYLREKVKERTR